MDKDSFITSITDFALNTSVDSKRESIEDWFKQILEPYVIIEKEKYKLLCESQKKDICEHDFSEPVYNWCGEFQHYVCSKCGEEQI